MAIADRPAPRILIVRRDNIGDLACTTPLIDALRARHPDAHLAALGNTYNAEVLARNPALDAVHAYEKLKHRRAGVLATLYGTWRLMARLRAQRFDVVLVPSATPRALQIARSLRPGQVLGPDTAAGAGRHEVERAYALGASLGVTGTPGPMRVYPDPVVVARLKATLHAKGERPIGVHISARRPAQRWPAERYAELIAALAQRAPVVLLWAPGAAGDARHPGDDEAARAIAARAPCIPAPTPDLATLVGALSLCGGVLCPDGGAMHLAAALGKPVLALFGDSPVERWRPWGVPHRVIQPATRTLADLPVAEVLARWTELASELAGTRAPSA